MLFWACQDDRVVAPEFFPSFPVGDYAGTYEALTVQAGTDSTALSQSISLRFLADGTFRYAFHSGPNDSNQVFCDVMGEYAVGAYGASKVGLSLLAVDSNFTRGVCPFGPEAVRGFWEVDTVAGALTLYQESHDPDNEIDLYKWLRLRRK